MIEGEEQGTIRIDTITSRWDEDRALLERKIGQTSKMKAAQTYSRCQDGELKVKRFEDSVIGERPIVVRGWSRDIELRK